MQLAAVGLVLFSALLHASWNALAKRSTDPLAYFFVFNIMAFLIWGIPAAIMLARHPIPPAGYLFMLISGTVHTGYFVSLAAAYRYGALSVAYPTARGTGVFLVPLLAIPIFGERPTAIAALGIAAILTGLALIGYDGLRQGFGAAATQDPRGIVYALFTGLTIATYSLVDNAGAAEVHPIVYVYGQMLIATAQFGPYVLAKRRREIGHEVRHNWLSAMIGGGLSLGTYMIIIAALRLANVGYVVPLRETSIAFGTLIGIVVLGERASRLRIAASAAIAGGAVIIALGG